LSGAVFFPLPARPLLSNRPIDDTVSETSLSFHLFELGQSFDDLPGRRSRHASH
jgi:hypothetical protein